MPAAAVEVVAKSGLPECDSVPVPLLVELREPAQGRRRQEATPVPARRRAPVTTRGGFQIDVNVVVPPPRERIQASIEEQPAFPLLMAPAETLEAPVGPLTSEKQQKMRAVLEQAGMMPGRR